MKIAIIGGGITGLTAAYELSKSGHAVTVFERESYLGGLAYGFKAKNWKWHLEGAYHHMFTNDDAILSLARELGIGEKLITKRPVTANYWQGTFHQFDSPMHLLKFNGLSLSDKLRTGALVAFCKLYPFWQTLEGVTAKEFFVRFGGKRSWDVIWEPLMTGKFGSLDSTIAASWLWARIHKRTPSLVYIEGGFQTIVNVLEQAIVRHGGTVYSNTSVDSISKGKSEEIIIKRGKKIEKFDRILITTPTPIAKKLLPDISTSEYFKLPSSIPHLHAQVLILETKKPILEQVYWLSIIDRSFPFLAVVAHTNFMDSVHYGGKHLTYVGNYLPDGHTYLNMTKQQLLKEFMPYIKHICPTMDNEQVTNSYLFTAPYAQPVHQINYSQRAPQLITPIAGVYLANMDSIFPWDRGTNYAVELGQRAAMMIASRQTQ